MTSIIELVKKFLADNDSVTLEELKANKKAARAALWAFLAAYWADELEDAEYYKKLVIEAIAKYEELTK